MTWEPEQWIETLPVSAVWSNELERVIDKLEVEEKNFAMKYKYKDKMK